MRPPNPASMPSSWPFCRRVKANPPRGAAAVIAPVVATVVSDACNGGTVISVVCRRAGDKITGLRRRLRRSDRHAVDRHSFVQKKASYQRTDAE